MPGCLLAFLETFALAWPHGEGHVESEGSVTETSPLMASVHIRSWKVLLTPMQSTHGGQFQLRSGRILLQSPNLEEEIMPRTGQRQERFASAVEQAEGFYFRRAERLNGRLAMVGFAVGVATEALTGHSLINQVVFGVLGLSL